MKVGDQMTKTNQPIKDLTLIVVATSILFVQQMALSFIPNIQLSVLLVILYTRLFGFRKTVLIVTIHVIIVNLFSPLGPVLPVLLPAMYIAWLLIPVLLSTIFKTLDNAIGLAIFAFIYGFVYGWIFIPFNVWLLDAPFLPYLLADLPFEVMMAVANFLSVLWLYQPLKKALQTHMMLPEQPLS